MKDCSSVKRSFGGVRLALFLFLSFFLFLYFHSVDGLILFPVDRFF